MTTPGPLPQPGLELACRLSVQLASPLEKGAAPGGQWRIIPIIGGTVDGPKLRGTVLNLGADWQTVWDSHAELDTRYAMETHDGALIDVRNFGYRHGPPEVLARIAAGDAVDPSEYYMRTQARLQSGDPRYQWVNRTIFIGTGHRLADAVQLALYAVT